MSEAGDLRSAVWFAVVVTALVVLFAAGLRPRLPAPGPRRWIARAGFVAVPACVALLASVALFRHDTHLDLSRERAFTPAPETLRVVRGLDRDVELVYFYQKQDPAGRAAKSMVELLGRLNPRLSVQTVDPDRSPGVAGRYGARLYNAAVLLSAGRRVEVTTTDDRDIALALLRVTRVAERVICFASGHGEFDIDNFEFHTHFEGTHAHGHNVQGMAIVRTEAHGVGRVRRALEKLGLSARTVTLATAGRVPEKCAALVDANPRTAWSPPEVDGLGRYLESGGAALLLIEPDHPVEPRLAELLGRAGVRIADGVVVDPRQHYFTDEQMVAVTAYAAHPATAGLALTFFPGVRPLEALPAPGVAVSAILSSSAESYVVTGPGVGRVDRARGARAFGLASEGRWGGARPFRLVVVGDADFASNSFFPYMSNADLTLGLLAWLLGEERAPTMKPPIEVLPTVTLTGEQVRGIFLATVLGLPGLVAVIGGAVWWARRR